MKTTRLVLASLAFGLLATPAFAGADCSAKVDGPTKSKEEITSMLEQQGYKIRKLGSEDGCVEMKGTDKDGTRVEVYVHPVSGQIVKTKKD